MSERDRIIVTALGDPGMGKSALARKLIDRYRARRANAVTRILDPGQQWEDGEWPVGGYANDDAVYEWIDGITNHGEGPTEDSEIDENGALVVLDDADRYIPPHVAKNPFRVLWLANRHLRLDVIVNGHRPQGVPKELIMASHELWLFAIDEPYALEYLSKMPTLRMLSSYALPTKPGVALRVLKRERRVETVKLF